MKPLRRICLVSPGHLSTNPRLVKEAQALSRAGYAVHIVHGRYSAWGARHDSEMTEPGWMTHSVAFGRKEASLAAHVRQKAVQNAAQSTYRLGFRSETLAEAAQAPVTRDLIRKACEAPCADLYVAHYTAALPAAAAAARLHGSRYAFDAEDFHAGDLPDTPEHHLAKAIIRQIERTYLPGAAYVTAASPLIAQAYRDAYSIPRPVTLLNAVSRRSAPVAPAPAGTARPGPSLYWFSQTIGPGRGLETALRAIAACRSKPHFYIRGTLAASYEAALHRLASALGIAGQIHLLDPVSPAELERAGAAYDLGFSGEPGSSRNNQIALGNKVFSYMCSGLPVALASTAAHVRFALGKEEYAFLFHDAGDLSAQIDELFADPARLAHARAAAFDAAAATYNWERESQTFLRLVEDAVGHGGGTHHDRAVAGAEPHR